MMLLLLSAISAWAAPDWREATVKITSFPCLTESPRYEGSGLVFAREGASYLITSEHVVLHSREKEICHEAGGQRLDLVDADFAAGLALLRFPVAEPGAVAFADLREDSGPLSALGFPAGSESLAVLANGTLLTATSRRALIAGQPTLLEGAGLPVEYGMSGGVLLSGNGFAGILSHQVLRREAGKATRPQDLTPGPGSDNDLVLAVPAAAVKNWITSRLAGERAEWRRDSASQRLSRPALRYGSLLFSLKQGKGGDVWDIGGSDGSGIGGDEPNAEELSYIEMSFVPGATPAEKSRVFRDPSLDRWREWLLAGKKVRLLFLKNPAAKRLLRLQSLSQFLTFWQRDGWTPVAIRSRLESAPGDAEKMLQRARTLETLAQGARDRTANAEKKAWFALLRDQGVMAENLLVSSGEVAALLGGENDRYWREFYDEDFERAVELEAAIQLLIEQMKKMGL